MTSRATEDSAHRRDEECEGSRTITRTAEKGRKDAVEREQAVDEWGAEGRGEGMTVRADIKACI